MTSAQRQPQLAITLLALLPLSWLVPNHFFPWAAAWQDGPALALTLLAVLLLPAGSRPELPRVWWLAALLVTLSVAWQMLSGRIRYSGDGWMVLLYVGAFVCAMAAGSALVRQQPRYADWLAGGLVAAAGVSVGLALVQWLRIDASSLWVTDLAPGARPFANLAQPNQLASALFLGLCALAVLRERERLSRWVWALGSGWLLTGMVMTGSRTSWLQIALLGAAALLMHRRCALVIRRREIVLMLAFFAAASLAWPTLNAWLQLDGGRVVTSQLATGTGRLPLWQALLHAVLLEPWQGHGWQQVVHAQLAVALEQPPVGRQFEHAHNIVLDLVLWAGLPVGLGITALAAAALGLLGGALRDPRAFWLWLAVLGVVLHGMLELPLEYAYLLLPCGALLGAATALSLPAGRPPREWLLIGTDVPALAVRALAGLLIVLLALVGRDYALAEPNHRLLRLESARIGTDRIVSQAPELHVLDQLEAFLRFARTPAKPGMSAAELEEMRTAARRFAYPPSMLRHALAAGLNGQPQEAALVLRQLCSVHPRERCEEAREAWRAAQQQHAVLKDIPAP